jgi:iron complex outermembrane receptor protein
LPAITVVGQKLPADSQTAPLSSTSVERATLDDAGIRYVNDAAGYVPNIFITEFSARKLSNPRFRGIGAGPNNPGVTTYIDGVPQLNANTSSMELIDVDQIDFIRGAQGGLFGRNTIGGLINITSTRPSLEKWTGGATGTYGNYSLYDGRITTSAPLISGQLGLGVGFGYSQREGYTKNDVTGNDLDSRAAYFGKGQLLWVPAENWEARLIVGGESARDGDYALNDLAALRARPFHSSRNYEGYTHRDIFSPTLLISHNGPVIDFSATTGFVWWKAEDTTDLDYSAAPLITRLNHEKALQFTEEIRLGSAKDAPINLSDSFKLKWQTGLSFFTQNYQQDAINNYGFGVLYQPGSFFPGFPASYSPPNSQHSPQSKLDDKGVGGYGQATVTAWEKLDISAGIRADYEDREANLRTFFDNADPNLGPGSAPVDVSRSFRGAPPQFALAYHFTPAQTVYGTAGRGYKAGGFNAASPAGSESYGVEQSWNYEAGWKGLWLENRLTTKVAAFYIDWSDIQLNLPNPATPGQFYVGNGGGAISRGVEFEMAAHVAEGLDFFGGVGYTDAHFTSGSTSNGAGVGGNQLTYTPDYSGHAGAQYSFAVCKEATFYARAEVIVYGSYEYDEANKAGQDAYSLANFRAGLRGKHWFVEGWARNAFDTRYVPIAFAYPGLAASGYVGEMGAPVTFGVTAGIKF